MRDRDIILLDKLSRKIKLGIASHIEINKAIKLYQLYFKEVEL